MSTLLSFGLTLALAQAEVAAPSTPEPAPPSRCDRDEAAGLPMGPVAFGFSTADFSSARRACPRSEVGLGVRGLGIIDTPNFYGNVGAQALVFGSVALTPKTELFGTLEALTIGFTQNATLTKTEFTLGHFTAGVSQVVYGSERLSGALVGRVLLPTSFEIPGMRLLGADVGHTVSFRPLRWLEVHGSASVELTFGVGQARSDPRVAGALIAGAMWQPTSWFGLVVDLAGRFGRINALAPLAGVRFRIGSFGIELAAGLPIVGNDRHDFAGTARFSWRF